MKSLINVALVVMATMAAPAYAQQFELKGIRFGTKETDLKKVYAKAKCGDTGNPKNLRPGEARHRLCNIPDFTVADQRTEDARFWFVNDQLLGMAFILDELSLYDLKRALVSKYGEPTFSSSDSLKWKLKDAQLWMLKVDDKISFRIDSPMAMEFQERARVENAKRSASDL